MSLFVIGILLFLLLFIMVVAVYYSDTQNKVILVGMAGFSVACGVFAIVAGLYLSAACAFYLTYTYSQRATAILN